MSRSHHATRRQLKELEKTDFSDKEKQVESVSTLKEELKTKRQTKEQVLRYRQSRNVPPVTPVELIPIKITCKHPFVHFPASPDDLRAMMSLLPAGIADGLTEIELGLGDKVQKEYVEEWRNPPGKDPYTGRLSYDKFPGVYGPWILGLYSSNHAKIKVYGYVYPPDLKDRSMWEYYLRMQMLMTFAHELWHHKDYTTRIARGRWRADDRDKKENYANKNKYEWFSSCVIPFLEKIYPDDWAALRMWIRIQVGIDIPAGL